MSIKLPDLGRGDDEGSQRSGGVAKEKFDGMMSSIKGMSGPKALDPGYKKIRASAVERSHEMSVVGWSVIVVVVSSLIMFLVVVALGEVWSLGDYVNNIFCNNIALIIIVLFLDTIVSSNKESRVKRNEARKILRYNRLIQPDIDLYLVGISKIKRYGHFQEVLRHDFSKLVENVDFVYYPEIAEAVMKYLNATSYGEAALDAVIGYEDARAGTKSMRVMVTSMIREEPENGSFMQANPTMKNVYLVHQMINDQEKAVSEYLRLIRTLEDADPVERKKRAKEIEDEDYE